MRESCGVYSDMDQIRQLPNSLLADNFDKDAFAPVSVEFAVENLFPRPEVEFAFCNCDDDFAAHDLTLEMGVSVVFAGAIVSIGGCRRVRRQFFQPLLVVMMKSRLIVVDEHRGSDVHGVDKAKALGHAAALNEFLDLRCDVDEPASIRYFEPKMFGE
jgi:hypothetical protein